MSAVCPDCVPIRKPEVWREAEHEWTADQAFYCKSAGLYRYPVYAEGVTWAEALTAAIEDGKPVPA